MEINVTPTYTEIYTTGGGNFITQAAPTNFHTFHTRRILTANETTADYREVTPAERDAIERSDAAWEAPDERLLNDWARACSHSLVPAGLKRGDYYHATGYFSLNGLHDITTAQAREILFYGGRIEPTYNNILRYGSSNCRIRTNLLNCVNYGMFPVFNRSFAQNTAIEVIVAHGDIAAEAFAGCRSAHTIYYRTLGARSATGAFSGCTSLVHLRCLLAPGGRYSIDYNLDFSSSPGITLESWQDLIGHAANTSASPARAITVHPDVFARLADETDTEWHSAMQAAAQKNISFISA